MKKLYFALFAVFQSFNGFSQFLTVDNTTQTPTQLVQNVLVGTGITVSNVMFNGTTGAAGIIQPQAGQFNGTTSNIGLANGIILGSGDVQLATGPNSGGGMSLGSGTGSAMDPDLAAITPNAINDEAILEFDFVPQGDSLKFKYVFASEEYDEYVCGSVNDAFGFFLSGPGISGPYTGGAANIALIPGTNTPVSINTVNIGVPGSTTGGDPTNCDNIDPAWASYNIYYTQNLLNSVEYDGFTVVLEAKAAVQCGETYHIKLAIGDAGDGAWDSGVFLEAGSFSSNAVDVTITTPTSSGFINGEIYEGCVLGTAATFFLVRPDAAVADTVPFSFSGSAILGADYTSSTPDTFAIFPAGQDTAFFGVNIINDGIVEGRDSLIVTVYNINPCGDTLITTGTLYINDPLIVVADILDDTITCPGQVLNLVGNVSGSPLPFIYEWTGPGLSATTQNTTWAPPSSTSIITFTAVDQCGFGDIDTATIYYIPSPVTVDAGLDDTIGCVGQIVNLNGITNGGTLPFTHSWTGPGLSASTQNTTYAPTGTSTVIYSVVDDCGFSDSDTLTVFLIPIPVIANAGPDLNSPCPGQNVNITGSATMGGAPYDYSWANMAGGTIGTTQTVTVSPMSTTSYVVNVEDQCGQTDSDTMTVFVTVPTPFVLSFDANENVVCPGDTVNMPISVVSGGSSPYTYLWNNGDNDNIGNYTIFSSPTIATVEVTDACGQDSTVSITITYPDYDPIIVTATPGQLCFSPSSTAEIAVTSTGGAGGNTFSWIGPLTTVIVTTNPSTNGGVVQNPVDGLYTVIVVDQCGAIGGDTVAMSFIPCDITIPNIVTPNGDGLNDEIHIVNLEYHPNSSFTLFNRWGQEMYKNENYKNDYKPSDLTDGVYFYVLVLTDGTTPAEYTGSIQVQNN